MKNLNGIIFITIFSLLTTGCMPESLTKFKKDTVQNATADVTFTDEDGNVIDGSTINIPTSFNYPNNQITFDRENSMFMTSTASSTSGSSAALVEGDLGDIGSQVGIENLNPVYTISPPLPSGLSLDSESGEVTSSSSTDTLSLYPSTTHIVTLTYLNPNTLLRESISTSVTVAIQEPIDESFRLSFGDNAATKKMYLTLSEEVSNFSVSGPVSASRSTNEESAVGNVRLVNTDTNTIVIDVTSGEFRLEDLIDNSTTYSGEEGSVESLGYYFETSSGTTDNIHLSPITDSSTNLSNTSNGVRFTISPDLPSGLSFDNETGEITGRTSTSLTSTTYTVRAYNDVDGSGETFSFNLAVIDSPQVLGYNSSVVLSVNDASDISIGDYVATNFTPPLTSGATGIVEFKSNDYIVVKITGGTFQKEQSLDINRTYVDEEAIITADPKFVNAALIVSSSTGLTTQDSSKSSSIICSGSTARATIMEIDTAPTSPVLFISQSVDSTFTGNFTDNGVNTIQNTSSCGSTASGSSSSIAIQGVWSPTVSINIATPTDFHVGQDVNNSSNAAGTISSVSGNEIVVSMVTENQFRDTDTITNNAIGNDDSIGSEVNKTSSVNSVSTNNKFELRRGTDVFIEPFLILGSENYYTISPELPDGLELDSSTGIISGNPTEATTSETFTITATNSIGSTTSVFDIEVVDYFEVIDIKNGPSYVLHKEGRFNNNRACRVNKKAIENFSDSSSDPQLYNVIDIDCFMEVGENDLYNLGLDFQVDSGPDVCEFVDYYPYSYWQFQPKISTIPSSVDVAYITTDSCDNDDGDRTGQAVLSSVDGISLGESDNVPAGTINGWSTFDFDEETFCDGNYRDNYSNSGNVRTCDFGTERHWEISLTDGTTSGCKVEVTQVTNTCDGSISECIAGAAAEQYSTTQLDSGVVKTTTAASNGLVTNFAYQAPISQGFNTNISLANYAATNSCTSGSYDYSSHGWYERTNISISNNVVDPFMAAQPFYTFACTNSGGEIKARIRVMVRDWNFAFSKSDVIDNVADTTLMDLPGEDVFDNAYNERNDFDNLLVSLSSPYAGCSGSAAKANATDDIYAPAAPSPQSISITGVTVNAVSGSPIITAASGSFTSFTSSGINPSGTAMTSLSEGVSIRFNSNTYVVKKVISSTVVQLTSPALSASAGDALSLDGAYRFPSSLYR